MEAADFISKFQEALDIKGQLTQDSVLKDFPEWDSLGKVVIGTLIRMDSGNMPSTQTLNEALKISDLVALTKV